MDKQKIKKKQSFGYGYDHDTNVYSTGYGVDHGLISEFEKMKEINERNYEDNVKSYISCGLLELLSAGFNIASSFYHVYYYHHLIEEYIASTTPSRNALHHLSSQNSNESIIVSSSQIGSSSFVYFILGMIIKYIDVVYTIMWHLSLWLLPLWLLKPARLIHERKVMKHLLGIKSTKHKEHKEKAGNPSTHGNSHTDNDDNKAAAVAAIAEAKQQEEEGDEEDIQSALNWKSIAQFISYFMFRHVMIVICILSLLLQPHVSVCKIAPFIGAIHGAASLICVSRALQLFLYPEHFLLMGKWQRMFFMSSWGWHDIRYSKPIKQTSDIEQVKIKMFISEMKRATVNVIGMVLCALLILYIGKLEPLTTLTMETMTIYHPIRWLAGGAAFLFWFEVMDAFPCALHVISTNHELESLCDDPFTATNLKEFWGVRWNIPIQRLLVSGVYIPISRNMRFLGPIRKPFAKFMVFFVSGLGHSYLLVCAGEPIFYIVLMTLYFLLQIPLLVLEDTFKLDGIVWIIASQIWMTPMFVEPVLHFIGV